MNNYKTIKYNQGFKDSIETFYTTIVPFKFVDKYSKVMVYNYNRLDYGYQRALNTSKCKLMSKDLLDGNLISPTSIILSCSKSDFEKHCISARTDGLLSLKEKTGKIFRIVDGQHRIEAIRIASDRNADFLDYMLNVIIYIVEDNNRYPEVKMFNDINSKATGVKLDLAILAKYNYDILENKNIIDIIEHVTVLSMFNLNKDPHSVWQNGIKIDVNDKKFPGNVGFKSYYESIVKIVKKYIKQDIINDFVQNERKEKFKIVSKLATEINRKIFIPVWKAIEEKWPYCFQDTIYEYEKGDFRQIKYKDSMYIQKTVGVKAVNKLIDSNINIDNLSKSISKICELINNSPLVSSDWEKGGIFTGLSSLSGVNVIYKILESGNIDNR